MKLISTILSGGAGRLRALFALGALAGLLAAALLTLAPAAADGHPDDLALVLSVVDESDNIVPPNSEITVRADLRFALPGAVAAPPSPTFTPYRLRVPEAGMTVRDVTVGASTLWAGGEVVWDGVGRRRLNIADQTVINSQVTPRPPGVQSDRFIARAFDGRTLIMRGSRNNHTQARVFIYDAHTLTLAHTFATPAGSGDHYGDGFGATSAGRPIPTQYDGGWAGSAIAVWHETDTRAWLFIGSSHDNVVVDGETVTQMGRLHIFQLDWTDDGVTVTPRGVLHPPKTESDNRPTGSSFGPKYAGAVTISRDGGTLAVSAHQMNHMGAIYVYTRPDGEGEDWGDIAYDDGVKVTVAAVPSWGDSATNRPFDPAAAGTCDSWCSRVWSVANTDGEAGADLGVQNVSLSADGRVLLAGASQKEYSSTTPGGGFTGRLNDRGDAFVWVAPEGGWRNAPRADQDAEGNAKTLIAAGVDASDFRQATHYSPGPLRRWTEPAVILSPEAWPSRGPNWTLFGSGTAISPDGTVAAVDDGRGFVRIFQRDSVDDWKTFNGGYLSTPSASLGSPIQTGIRDTPAAFSYDGSQLAVGDHGSFSQAGALRVYTRPADGVWASATPFVRVREPVPVQNQFFGYIVPETSGPRAVISSTYRGGTYLAHATASAAMPDDCRISMVDGIRTASCPIPLTDPTIVIPAGTPDGTFTISGSVALQIVYDRTGAGGTWVGGVPFTLRDTLEVTVGEVDELAEVVLDFDTNPATGLPYSGAVGPGESTTLRLRLLNEHGKASAKGAISTVLFTVGQGTLSARVGAADADACATTGVISCQIANAATELTANNADQIRLTVNHPGTGKSGPSDVRVTVVGSDGESFEVGPIALVFSGPPSAIALSAPNRGLLSHDTCDTPSAAGADDCKLPADRDDRDLLTLQVTATDAAGNKATVPTVGYGVPKVTGPDGKRVGSDKIAVTWPLRKGGDGTALDTLAGAPQALINVNAARTAQLAVGEYTVELSVGSLKATQTFSVSGPPADIALSAPAGELAVQGRFSVTASVSDAGGGPVPDGTAVNWSATPIGVASTLVETSREDVTKDGQASASYLIVAPGSTSLRVTAGPAGEVATVALIEVPGPPAPPVRLLDLLAAPYTQGSNTWFGEFAISASSLLRELPNADVVHIWQGGRWFRYSQVAGEVGEESIDFTIHPNAVLWFGDDD